jgi:tRNA G18 (ribose-2'-O)-methylase SpoU
MRDHLALLPPETPVYLAEQPILNQVVGFNIHRGILAAGIRPQPPDLTQLLARARTLVILEDLANHDNVGGIFRATAALAGLPLSVPSCLRASVPSGSAILLSPGCADPLYRKAIRVSMGAALHIPFARLEPWPAALAQVRAAGFTLIALTPAPDAAALSEVVRPARPALLLGAEGPGLSPEALAAADLRVRIPIDPAVDSLNVTVAGAIALAALARPGP